MKRCWTNDSSLAKITSEQIVKTALYRTPAPAPKLVDEPTPYNAGIQPNPKTKPLYCVDLFAGCGGLSLGLEKAGFHPLLFSELNKSAAETYVANRVGQGIIPWGDIYNLTDENLALLKVHWRYLGIEDIDLVCGGPPCQGYSGIGHRRSFNVEKKDIPSNHLYQEMARVIRALKPKVFLFENVRGLLNSRWTAEGSKGEVFKAVLAELKSIPGYTVRWQLVHAKEYGVPQNRPRVLVVGLRNDYFFSATQQELFDAPVSVDHPTAVEDGFLPEPSGTPPTLVDLLSDLEDPDYLSKGATKTYPRPPVNETQVYLRTRPDGSVMNKGEEVTEQEYSAHAPKIREKFAHMIANNGEIPEHMKTKKFAQRVFPKIWGKGGPNITATSLPEDYVHYGQPRGPTVREWARIQTFPDWYVFKGSRTTGGRRRAGDPDAGIWDRDVPRYTQIGNAVPVLLAHKVGEHFKGLLNRSIKPFG
jgi:DNA (cytosine-5)-methyltransferase 1